METTERKAFRKSFMGGFSKKDVNNYIAESSEKYTTKIKEAEDEISSLRAKLESAERELSELSGIKEKFCATERELEEKSVALRGAEEKIASLSSENATLTSRAEAFSALEKEYLEKKAELADIEISARERANKIIADAEAEAGARRDALSNELFALRRDFEDKKNAANREAAEAISDVSRLIDSLKNEIDSMELRITRITDSTKNNASCLSAAISDAEDKISKISQCFSENQ